MALITSLMRAWVALALNDRLRVPPPLPTTLPTVTPPSTRPSPVTRAPRLPLPEKRSWLLGPPLRARVRVAPSKLSADDSSASKIRTLPSMTTGEPFSV